MTDVVAEPLMVLVPASAAFNRIPFFEFFQNLRSEPRIHEVLGITCHGLRRISVPPPPLPSSQTKNMLIKFIWETLGPCGQFFPQIRIK